MANQQQNEEAERRRASDRRGPDRRGIERRTGLDRRRGPGRRRAEIRKSAEEGEISDELLEFVMAIDEYKRVNERPFPTWTEIYEIVQYLGYRRVAARAEHINSPTDAPMREDADDPEDAEDAEVA